MPVDRRPIDQMVLDVGAPAFQRLARLFEMETRQAVVEMRRLLIAEDWRELGRQAHSLKHSTASFGLVDLAATAESLEAAADAHLRADCAREVGRLEAGTEADLGGLERLLREL